MKKITSVVLAATLTTSILTPMSVDAAKSNKEYKVKNGKLVDQKGQKVSGYVTYKNKLYKNGKKLIGLYKGKFYKNGKLTSGTYKGVKYRKGVVFTGKSLVDGKVYNGGAVANNTMVNGVFYTDGKPFSGSLEDKEYVNGVLVEKPEETPQETPQEAPEEVVEAPIKEEEAIENEVEQPKEEETKPIVTPPVYVPSYPSPSPAPSKPVDNTPPASENNMEDDHVYDKIDEHLTIDRTFEIYYIDGEEVMGSGVFEKEIDGVPYVYIFRNSVSFVAKWTLSDYQKLKEIENQLIAWNHLPESRSAIFEDWVLLKEEYYEVLYRLKEQMNEVGLDIEFTIARLDSLDNFLLPPDLTIDEARYKNTERLIKLYSFYSPQTFDSYKEMIEKSLSKLNAPELVALNEEAYKEIREYYGLEEEPVNNEDTNNDENSQLDDNTEDDENKADENNEAIEVAPTDDEQELQTDTELPIEE